jgi:hypothetical protein
MSTYRQVRSGPTRRSLLAMAVGAAAAVPLSAAAAPSTASAADGGRRIPQTLVRRTRRPGPGLRVDQTAFALSHLGVGWNGGGDAAVRLKTAAGWSDWQVAHGCGAARDGAARSSSRLLPARGVTGYEVAGSGDLSITELNTVDGPIRTVGAASASTLPLGPGPVARYLSRPAWGADESLRFDADGNELFPTAFFPVQTLTVHHTVTANDDPDPAATVRAIYFFHTVTLEFGDVGYHLLIDEAGRVYEGRWSGPDRVPVYGGSLDASGHPQMVNAAHVGGFNAGNIGVALLGDFTNRLPTRAARLSLTVVLAVLASLGDLDPLGTADYVNPISGATRTVDVIPGHRDWLATECPGNTFYPQLPSVRRQVERLVPPGH